MTLVLQAGSLFKTERVIYSACHCYASILFEDLLQNPITSFANRGMQGHVE